MNGENVNATRVFVGLEGLLALVAIGATVRWLFLRCFRGSPVTCPQCRREARWLGNLPAAELHGYCLYCRHCGIMISVLETDLASDDGRSRRPPFDPLPAWRGLNQHG
jgi:hypothetical protein